LGGLARENANGPRLRAVKGSQTQMEGRFREVPVAGPDDKRVILTFLQLKAALRGTYLPIDFAEKLVHGD